MSELRKIRKDIKEEFERDRTKTKKDREEMRKEIKDLREEMGGREEKWEKRQERMEERTRRLEKKVESLDGAGRGREEELRRRIKALEEKIEQDDLMREGQNAEEACTQNELWKLKIEQMDRNWKALERKERKNNIVVRGKKWTESNEKEEIEKLLREELDLNLKVKRARVIGDNRTTVVVEMNSWEDKSAVMGRKNRLKGKSIFIDADMTKKEREIQKTLARRMKEEREKGAQAKFGYQKIQIQGKWWFWDEGKGELRADRRFQGTQGSR